VGGGSCGIDLQTTLPLLSAQLGKTADRKQLSSPQTKSREHLGKRGLEKATLSGRFFPLYVKFKGSRK
jgi:hypothetical protein